MMKNLTKQMPVDNLGRVVIPVDIRRSLRIVKNDKLKVYSEGKRVIFEKIENSCVVCNSHKNLHIYQGQIFCESCVKNLSKEIAKQILDNYNSSDLKDINNKIEIKRKELDKAIEEGKGYDCIYNISVELDTLIAEFYKINSKVNI